MAEISTEHAEPGVAKQNERFQTSGETIASTGVTSTLPERSTTALWNRLLNDMLGVCRSSVCGGIIDFGTELITGLKPPVISSFPSLRSVVV